MPSYSNGYIPEDLLVIFERGANTVDGPWYHGLSPATYARHLALVARAQRRTGKTLRISDGFGAYRPIAAQWVARNIYGNGAAYPGTSSHGGFWEGQQTLAMDYSNWGDVYGWDRDAFAEDARAVGLSPNLIVPARGYPDEPWHVVDLDPWSAVPTGGDFDYLEDDMGTIDDTPANVQVIKNALLEFFEQVRAPRPGQQWGFLQAVWDQPVQAQDGAGNLLWNQDGSPLTFPAGGYIASTNARVGGTPAEVDEAELAAALAPLLVGRIESLSDDDVARIAKASADEQARRLAG